MKKREIRKLEPKYTGNQRHLTEGEAAAIVHDPANGENPDGLSDVADVVPPIALLGNYRRP